MSPLVLATRNEHKLRELREALPGFADRPAAGGGRAAARGPARPSPRTRSARRGRRRPPPAGPRSPTTPGSRPTGWAGGPGCARPATRARTRPTRRTSRSSSGSRGAGRPPRRVRLRDRPGGRGRDRVALRGPLRGDARGASRGARGGFGYDPAFVPDDTGPDDERTMAELAPEEKHAISHRGRAARKLAAHLGVEVGRMSPAATAASSRITKPRAAAVSIASNSDPDRAEARGRRRSPDRSRS